MQKTLLTVGGVIAIVFAIVLIFGNEKTDSVMLLPLDEVDEIATTTDISTTDGSATPPAQPENKAAQGSGAQTPVETPGRLAADPRSISIHVGDATYVGVVPDGSTVLEAMELLRSEGLAFEGKKYPSLGYFVETINGQSNGGGKYWFLYINGESSDLGASQATVVAGDKIEWRFKESE